MADLHMVQVFLKTSELVKLGRARRLPLQDVDVGYLVHCALNEAFPEHAPSVFRSKEKGGQVEVLGYSEQPWEVLKSFSLAATALAAGALAWEISAGKVMPSEWAPGMSLGFECRVCPTVRMDKAGPNHREGAEVDVFLQRCWAAGRETPVDREAVYVDWLRRELGRNGAAELEFGALHAFRRTRVIRRTQGADRVAKTQERPDALMRGRLKVASPEAFAQLLKRGLGRHRGFGFGMLLLSK